MPHPLYHHDYHRALSKPIQHSASANWSRGVVRSAPTIDDQTILQNPTIKPAHEIHKLQHQETIKLAEQSTSAYLAKFQGTNGLSKDIQCRRSDLPFHVFNEIDAALFSGVLKGNVHLKWAPLPPMLFGRTIRAGRDDCPRIAIELAEHLMAGGAPEDILEVLVHQMIHAFLLQCCGHKNRGVTGNGHDLKHGLEYSTIAYIIQASFFRKKLVSFPAEIGCFAHPAHRVGSNLFRYTYSQNEAGGSFCCPTGSAISFNSAEKHYEYVKDNTLAPKLDLPNPGAKDGKKLEHPISQYIFIFDDGNEKASPHVRGSAKTCEPHIELQFKDCAYMMKRTRLSNLASISDRTTLDPVIDVPADDEETFKRLYDFMDNGDYKPSVKERQDTVSGTRRGPPRIVDFEANGQAYLQVDIKMYRLAMAMDFPELKKWALARLRAQSFMNEDPCAVLEHIYHGSPAKSPGSKSEPEKEKKPDSKEASKKPEIKGPDDGIRQFVRDWLKVKSESKDFSNNLDILQRHPLWSDKYKKLREQGSELITDVDAVELEIKKAKKEQPKSSVPTTPLPGRISHIPDHIQRVLLSYLSAHPGVVPSTQTPQLVSPAEYHFPSTRHVYAQRRTQDDSEIMPNSQRLYYDPRSATEEEIFEAVMRDLADAYPE